MMILFDIKDHIWDLEYNWISPPIFAYYYRCIMYVQKPLAKGYLKEWEGFI